MVKRIVSLLILFFFCFQSFSQDTLPDFALIERGDKVLISWVNPYQKLIQLNVQRSYDSLRYFQTVYSAISPELPQNGFTEKKMPTNKIFYRIFYVLEGGAYFFTKSKKLSGDVAVRSVRNLSLFSLGNNNQMIQVKIKDSLFTELSPARYRVFRDSILQKTRDTLYAINETLVDLRLYQGKDMFRASQYVFTTRDGISISLPNANSRKYSLKFFEENGTLLFEIRHVKEPHLILDKANFFHAGWFHFELYENDILKEKNRFYLSKEF